MKFTAIGILAAAWLASSHVARAAFHLFEIQEIYSNADGSVQFIELFTNFGSQQFLTGHTVTYQIGAAVQGTSTLAQLPGDTTNKTFLVGTANLGTLYNVVPDFVIPANFLAAGSNSFINFAEGTDRVNLTLLPNNGSSSLNGQVGNFGQTPADTSTNAAATPKNFAGQTATIPEPSGGILIVLTIGAISLFRRRF